MSMDFETPLTLKLLCGSKEQDDKMIIGYRNKPNASWGRVVMTAAMLAGTLLFGVAETVGRVALAALVFFPMMLTKNNRTKFIEKFIVPIATTVATTLTIPVIFVENIFGKTGKDDHGISMNFNEPRPDLSRPSRGRRGSEDEWDSSCDRADILSASDSFLRPPSPAVSAALYGHDTGCFPPHSAGSGGVGLRRPRPGASSAPAPDVLRKPKRALPPLTHPG